MAQPLLRDGYANKTLAGELMIAAARYTKTPKGQEEITARHNNLRGKMRTMLILIDPAKPAEALLDQGVRIGVPPDFLDTLVREGYVAAVGTVPANLETMDAPGDEAARFRQAKGFMNETVVAALGIRAFMFTLRLERCATRVDLEALMPDYQKALRKVASEPEANALEERMRELLA